MNLMQPGFDPYDTPIVPKEGQLWRGKTFDGYVRILKNEAGVVTVQPTDIGMYAGQREAQFAPYFTTTGFLNKDWRPYL